MFHDDSREARKMAEIIDRRLTLSYSSLLFLRRHGFDLAKVLGSGASYLGRNDLEEVMAQMLQDRNYERVDPAGLGETAVKFYAELQEELTKWLDGLPKEVCDAVSISVTETRTHCDQGCIFRVFEPHGGTIRRSTVQMVQQLVREDFPTCRCWRDRDGWAMNIEVTDLEAEDKVVSQHLSAVKSADCMCSSEQIRNGGVKWRLANKWVRGKVTPALQDCLTPDEIQASCGSSKHC